MRLVCCLVLLLGGLQLTCALLVAAWNIRCFAEKKANNAAILNHIATVVRRYDVIVIQEHRDKSTSVNPDPANIKDDKRTDLPAVNALMKLLNPNGQLYKHIVSYPLGSNTYKERYLFIYKISEVTPLDSCNYVVTPNPFSRPPFSVKFKAVRTALHFVMIPLHAEPKSVKVKAVTTALNVKPKSVKFKAVTTAPTAEPDKTVAEINALHAVVQDVKAKWNTQNILLLGDFNADGTYLPGGDTNDKITLTEAKGYHWLIRNGVKTNVAQTNTYDRIVATTSMEKEHVVANSAKVFNFKAELNLQAKPPRSKAPQCLGPPQKRQKQTGQAGQSNGRPAGIVPPLPTDTAFAEDVSDHFPVEVRLR